MTSTFDSHLEGKAYYHVDLGDVTHHSYDVSDVQKAKQEALKSWFEKHKRYCNFCEDEAMCKTAQLTEQEFGRME